MQADPLRYWQDLTENYGRMSDGELLELNARPEDLTEVAQQVLRDEMRKRGLDKARVSPPAPGRPGTIPGKADTYIVDPGFGEGYVPSPTEDLEEEEDSEDGPSTDYTWKTLLCDCESNEQAWQLREALRRRGIESWVRSVSRYSMDLLGPQIYVAADELEAAQAIAAQPIPQDIIYEWNTVIPEFEPPRCPHCGTSDSVTLEGTEPVNAWFCEECGREWNDPEDRSSGSETAS